MGKIIGVNTILHKEYPVLELAPMWRQHLGRVGRGFSMSIWGESGHGKTSYTMQMCKELALHGKVLYNSKEEGDSSTIQDAYITHNMQEVKGRMMLGDRLELDEMIEKMRKGRYQTLVCDSVDYLGITKQQYISLREQFKHANLIFLNWQRGDRPKTQAGKDIMYMSDIKTQVKNYVAYARSRWGSLEDFVIWPEKVQKIHRRNGQVGLFEYMQKQRI